MLIGDDFDTRAGKPRDLVIAEWIVAEFEVDTVADVIKGCVRVIASLSAAEANSPAEALVIARAACTDLQTLTQHIAGPGHDS